MNTISEKIDSAQVRAKIAGLLDQLGQGLYEREEAVRLALLSTIAGESIFLLGPPGVGKSLIARRLKFAFLDGTSFEYLMSRFSTPDEIFGPVSIKKLKEEDKYERLTERYLPGANIVFLDEIWKSGPAIQNALLTILNEKIYRNGEQEIHVDIKGIITASNELPPQSESFQPLWDRMLIRYSMGGIRKQQNFLRMITDTRDVYADEVEDSFKISKDELSRWNGEIDQIELPSEVLNTLQVIRLKIDQYNEKPKDEIPPFRIYDRRWKKLVRLIRTSAFLCGRQSADLMDCFLSIHCLWNHPSQISLLQEIVSETIRKHGYSIAINLNMLRREIESLEKEVNSETQIAYTIVEDKLEPVQEEYYSFVLSEKPFHGDLLKISDFNKLSAHELQVINIYDQELNLRHRLKARKSKSEHTVDIFYNSVEATYSLQTNKAERREIIYKKPHELVARHWDELTQKLNSYIDQQQSRLQTEEPSEIYQLDQNLFIDKSLSKIVKANLHEVEDALDNLKLRLEKIHYAYTRLA